MENYKMSLDESIYNSRFTDLEDGIILDAWSDGEVPVDISLQMIASLLFLRKKQLVEDC